MIQSAKIFPSPQSKHPRVGDTKIDRCWLCDMPCRLTWAANKQWIHSALMPLEYLSAVNKQKQV